MEHSCTRLGAVILSLLLLCALVQAQTTAHGVLFVWTQSTAPGITANTLYCGTATKTYTMKWAFSSPTTSYDWLTTDATNPPVQGQTYFCAVTATKGAIESDKSPELSFPFPIVPLPPAGLSRTEH